MNVPNHKSIGSFLVAFALILLFILVVVKIKTDKEGSFLCQVVEASPTLSMEECPAHESYTSWLILAAFAVSLVVLGLGLYMLFLPLKKESDSVARQEIDVSKLSKEEARLYALVTENQGSLYQSDIIKQTGLSKVKVSRLLDRMEGKGIIERKRRGMTNIVILK
ncbi:MarR family transcriptional regulator [Candidatus Woesearchaeota archaeon]|nr:MarR family transcriptional regulator [Candidatus Woesearchaeota archaeon]